MTTRQQVSTNFRADSLDQLPLGMLRLSRDKSIVYLNRAAQEMLGPTVSVGTKMSEIAMDKGSRLRLQKELKERYRTERASTYELELEGEGGTKVVLEVNGVPEYDGHGELTGSLGFIRDRSVEVATMAIHRAIERSATWNELLKGVADEVRKVIRFHTFSVTLVSENRRHLRSLFEDPPHHRVSPIKWWPMPPFVKAMLGSIETSVLDLREMFSQPSFRDLAENDPATKEYLGRGFLHLGRLPIYRNKKLVAIVLLHRVDDVPFTDRDLQRLEQLPLGEAINIALTLDKKGEMQFWLDLIQSLGRFADNANGLRRHFVTQLRENYGWHHVALFRIDEDNRVFRLACQSPSEGTVLPNDYSQPFGTGFLDRVRKTGKAVVVGNVAERKHKKIYVPAIGNPRSEMCLPLPGGKLRWLLNVESELADAFADEEQEAVGLLLGVVGSVLDRVATSELKSAIFEAVADGVILTSLEGAIEEVNPAGLRLLGAGEQELRGKRLARFLVPNRAKGETRTHVEDVVGAKRVPSMAMKIRALSGVEREVLLSGATLPHDLGGKVYIASDLTYPRQVQEMERLRQVFGKVAAELRVPISLACSMLGDLAHEPHGNMDIAEKALAQLRKADLPLQRILRLASKDGGEALSLAPVDLMGLLERIKQELPQGQRDAIELDATAAKAHVLGASGELMFCLQSIAAFLLRLKAQADVVAVGVSRKGPQVITGMRLVRGPSMRSSATSFPELDDEMREFALAEGVVAGLVAKMGGRFLSSPHGQPRFEIALKAAEVGDGILATARS